MGDYYDPRKEPIKAIKILTLMMGGFLLGHYALEDFIVTEPLVFRTLIAVILYPLLIFSIKDYDERINTFIEKFGIFIVLGDGALIYYLWQMLQGFK